MSKAKMPPVPPANRAPQDRAQPTEGAHDAKSPASERDVNVEQQGQTANTRQNIAHQGRQQDR